MPDKLPEYQQSVKVRSGVATGGVQGAAAALATTPSALTEIGSKIATNVVMQQNEKMGYEMGQTPHGDLGISLTKGDEAVKNAYNTQAQSVLGLEGNKLFQKSQLAMASLAKITPEDMSNFHTEVTKGIDAILLNAPTDVKRQLSNQFQTDLMQASGNLSARYLKQQKAESADNATLFNKQQAKGILELGISGDTKGARASFEDFADRAHKSVADGTLKGSVADTQITSAWQSYWTGVYFKAANDAEAAGKLPQFEADLGNPSLKPKDVTYADWSAIKDNVTSLVKGNEDAKKKNQNLMLSKLNKQVSERGAADPSLTAEAYDVMTETQMNNFMAYQARKQSTGKAKQAQVDGAISSMDNAGELSHYSRDVLDEAHAQMVNADQNENKDKELFQSKIDMAIGADAVIPGFQDEVEAMLTSKNPVFMERASKALEQVNQENSKALDGLSDDAEATYTVYNGAIKAGIPIEIAAEDALNTVFGKDKDTKDAVVKSWAEYESRELNSEAKRFALVKNLGDTTWMGRKLATTIINPNVMANQFKNIFKYYDFKVGGDKVQAKELARKSIKRNYGLTHVNGIRQYTFLPLEHVFELPDNASSIIQNDIMRQAQVQFNDVKDAYDRNETGQYFTLKNKTDFQEVLKDAGEFHKLSNMSNAEMSASKGGFERMVELHGKLSEFQKMKPIMVIRHNRDGTSSEMELVSEAGASVSRTTKDKNTVIGDWILKVKSGDRAMPIDGLQSIGKQLVYRPSVQAVRKDWMDFYGKTGNELQDQLKEYIDKERIRAGRAPGETDKRSIKKMGNLILEGLYER